MPQQNECNVYQTVKRIGISKRAVQDMVFFTMQELHMSGSMSVTFIGDQRMQTLNRRYRGKDQTTDVLSFAAQEGDIPLPNQDYGDIFISVPQIQRQARSYGVTYNAEMARMLVHGVLHLLGYDHIRPRDAKVMMPLQDRIVDTICNTRRYGKA